MGGLYGDRATDDGMRIEEALSGPVFRRSPELTWNDIHQIEQACRALCDQVNFYNFCYHLAKESGHTARP